MGWNLVTHLQFRFLHFKDELLIKSQRRAVFTMYSEMYQSLYNCFKSETDGLLTTKRHAGDAM